jgi:hypothetical protein
MQSASNGKFVEGLETLADVTNVVDNKGNLVLEKLQLMPSQAEFDKRIGETLYYQTALYLHHLVCDVYMMRPSRHYAKFFKRFGGTV